MVAFDVRNHGESSYSPPVALGLEEKDDLLAVLRWMETNTSGIGGCFQPPVKRVGVWGESMGGALTIFALAGAEKSPLVKAAVLDCPYATLSRAITSVHRSP